MGARLGRRLPCTRTSRADHAREQQIHRNLNAKLAEHLQEVLASYCMHSHHSLRCCRAFDEVPPKHLLLLARSEWSLRIRRAFPSQAAAHATLSDKFTDAFRCRCPRVRTLHGLAAADICHASTTWVSPRNRTITVPCPLLPPSEQVTTPWRAGGRCADPTRSACT